MKNIGKFKKKYKEQVDELKLAKASRASIEAEIRAEYEAKLIAERQATHEAIAALKRAAADQQLVATNQASESLAISDLLKEAHEAIARQREENNTLVAKVAGLEEALKATEPRIAAADNRTSAAKAALEEVLDIVRNHEHRLRKKDEEKVDAVLNRAALAGVRPTRNLRS